ncbi:hypothetical protein [Lyngbya sp. PCC 8106]|uniref:hypothetical protein n=1 Tax=Lyngbya sp. (strain PCC 8106) TaxID=313612 RepID=UPI0000EA98BE|nr:hypothetical protein [Lyngbya sp. PCC 8106]EAW33378.1 hypothetical protein L8106_22761 [Lyngbya sp. PCC 8106]EAW35129.1 hypothetical protein L8106_13480 [Lyngbya sp. PCC 8106]
MRKQPEFTQLELPLYPKFKKRAKVRIIGLDSTGKINYRGMTGIVFGIFSDGVLVYFPGLTICFARYSVWEIELK